MILFGVTECSRNFEGFPTAYWFASWQGFSLCSDWTAGLPLCRSLDVTFETSPWGWICETNHRCCEYSYDSGFSSEVLISILLIWSTQCVLIDCPSFFVICSNLNSIMPSNAVCYDHLPTAFAHGFRKTMLMCAVQTPSASESSSSLIYLRSRPMHP